jgi:hypothetical protein
MGEGIVIHPGTGQMLRLDAPTEELATWLTEIRREEQQLREEKRRVTHELIARMDREASYTLRTGDLEIKGDRPTPPLDYDAPGLYEKLREYVEAEVITQEALHRAIEPVVTLKAHARGLDALRRLGGPIVEVIEQHAQPRENYERRVNIKPRGL